MSVKSGIPTSTGPEVHRPGRRSGAGDTREAILAAARDEFAARGYERATIRGIAAVAGVDPALVMRYFGSKAELFGAAISIPVEPAAILRRTAAAGVEGIGTALVGSFLDAWEDEQNRPRLVALLRSAMTNDTALAAVREYLDRRIFAPLTRELDLPDAELRSTLAGSQLIGLAMMRYVTCIEPLASVSKADLVATVGPSIQRYLTQTPLSPARDDDRRARGR